MTDLLIWLICCLIKTVNDAIGAAMVDFFGKLAVPVASALLEVAGITAGAVVIAIVALVVLWRVCRTA